MDASLATLLQQLEQGATAREKREEVRAEKAAAAQTAALTALLQQLVYDATAREKREEVWAAAQTAALSALEKREEVRAAAQTAALSALEKREEVRAAAQTAALSALLQQLVDGSKASEKRDGERAALLQELVSDLRVRKEREAQPLLAPRAAAPAGGGQGVSPGGGTSGSPPSSAASRQVPSPGGPATAHLLAAFDTAHGAGPAIALPQMPFPAEQLLQFGLGFAHRLCGGSFNDTRDFTFLPVGTDTFVLPPAGGKAGMSFFIPLSNAGEVLSSVHTLRGAAKCGCLAYPLDKCPPGLRLTVDKLLLSSPTSGPILLHASLSTNERTEYSAFAAAVTSWERKQVCIVQGQGSVDASQHDSPCARSPCTDATSAVLEGAALQLISDLKLAAQEQTSAAPPGGSPGTALRFE